MKRQRAGATRSKRADEATGKGNKEDDMATNGGSDRPVKSVSDMIADMQIELDRVSRLCSTLGKFEDLEDSDEMSAPNPYDMANHFLTVQSMVNRVQRTLYEVELYARDRREVSPDGHATSTSQSHGG